MSPSIRGSAAIWVCSLQETSPPICRSTSASAARRCPIWRATHRGAACCSCFHYRPTDPHLTMHTSPSLNASIAVAFLGVIGFYRAQTPQTQQMPPVQQTPSQPGTQPTYFVEHPDHIQPGIAFQGRWAPLTNPYEGNAQRIAEGAKLFVSYNCLDCHGVDG